MAGGQRGATRSALAAGLRRANPRGSGRRLGGEWGSVGNRLDHREWGLASLVGMPEDFKPEDDPAANTQMFQAFVDRREADEREAKMRPPTNRRPAWLAAAVGLVLFVALVWLALGR